jgi:SlyX protein
MEPTDMQERLTDIEIRVAHMDQALSELSDFVYEQQKLIQRLEQNCKELRQRVDGAADGATANSASDEKPPHY